MTDQINPLPIAFGQAAKEQIDAYMTVVLQGIRKTDHKNQGVHVGDGLLQGDGPGIEAVPQYDHRTCDNHHSKAKPRDGASTDFD